MSNRCIFVLIDGSARSTMRVELATRLASRWECDLGAILRDILASRP